MLKSSGPAGCHEVPGALPHRAGGGRHAVRGGEERKNLLPGLLQTLSQEIPRVRRGKLSARIVQGTHYSHSDMGGGRMLSGGWYCFLTLVSSLYCIPPMR